MRGHDGHEIGAPEQMLGGAGGIELIFSRKL